MVRAMPEDPMRRVTSVPNCGAPPFSGRSIVPTGLAYIGRWNATTRRGRSYEEEAATLLGVATCVGPGISGERHASGHTVQLLGQRSLMRGMVPQEAAFFSEATGAPATRAARHVRES